MKVAGMVALILTETEAQALRAALEDIPEEWDRDIFQDVYDGLVDHLECEPK